MLEVTHTKVTLAYALQFSFRIYFNPVVVTAFLKICYNLLTFEYIIAYTFERWEYISGYFTSSKS